MNTNGKRNVKAIEDIFNIFKSHNMMGKYDKESWQDFLNKNNLKQRCLKKSDNGNYSIGYSIKFELNRILEAKFITEKEYRQLIKQYGDDVPEEAVATAIENSAKTDDYSEYVPMKNDAFIEHGDIFKNIDKIVSNKMFFPVYIYGVSGVGKTFNVEQSCANNGRPYFRVQVTKDTTNEDLIGSYALINGNTIWRDGPILKAYRSGGVLLLDEVDLNPSLMILQGVLENKPVYVTQTGELVYPKEGFQVFATGNSKGDGNDYEYVGTSALNKAFLERFDWIIEQKIPAIAIERKIIKKYLAINKIEIEDNLLTDFTKWIDTVRKSFQSGDTSIYISTRRVQSILKGFSLTGDFEIAIRNAMSHYDPEETSAFLNVWKAIYVSPDNKE